MDKSELRELMMQMHDLRGMDDVYTFYYDETNNIRKFRIVEDSFNVADPGNFVLAGIVHHGKETPDIEPLIEALRLPKNVKELKLKYLGEGDFLSVLKSDKIGKLFCWLIENKLYIHYFNLNILFWSLTDIVDSVLAVTRDEFFINNNMSVKSDIYKIVMSDRETFVHTARNFNYPDIDACLAKEFVTWFCSFIHENLDVLSGPRKFLLKTFLGSMENVNELPFLEGERGHILIENFSSFYFRTLYMFPFSRHIFDSEEKIVGEVSSFNDTEDSNYSCSFVDSKTCRGVQLSDVIAGFLGKLFTFLRDSELCRLVEVKESLNEVQAENLRLLVDLIDRSDAVSNGFIHMVASEDEHHNRNYFLNGDSNT